MARKRLEVEIVADADSVPADIRKVADATDDTATKMGKLDTAARAAFAVLASGEVLAFANDLGKLGIQLSAIEGRADTVFGNMSDSARRWADSNNESFGVGTTALLGMQAAVADLLIPMGIARDQALGMSQDVLTTANALARWTGGTIDAAGAQERITKALLGERDGLVELGVKISEADLQMQLAKNGTDDLTGAALLQAEAFATLELITQRSADALRNYEESANAGQDAASALNARLADQKEAAAANFLPVYVASLETLNVAFIKVEERLGSLRNLFDENGRALADMRGELEATKVFVGDTDDAAALFLTTLKQTRDGTRENADALRFLVDELGLTRDEVLKLLNADDDWLESLGFTEEQIEAMREVLGDYKRDLDDTAVATTISSGILDENRAAHDRNRQAVDRTAEGVTIVRQETERYTVTLYDLLTAQAELANPALAAAGAIDRLGDAQQRAADAADRVKEAEDNLAKADTSKERREAQRELAEAQEAVSDSALELAGAQLQLETALARLRTEGGPEAVAALEDVLRTAGATEDQIREIISALNDYNRTPVSRKNFQAADGTRTIGSISARAGGGPAAGRTLVGEAGPEVVDLPRGSFVHSASASRRMAATGPNVTLNVTINGTMDLTNPSAMRNVARQLKAELEDLWRGEG